MRRPVAFALTPGNAHDLAGAKALLAIRCPGHKLLADRAYDAASLRDWLAERGTEPVIPPNPTRKNPHAYDRDAYRGRNRIERMFCSPKDFRRIATHYDKRADNLPVSRLYRGRNHLVEPQLRLDPRTAHDALVVSAAMPTFRFRPRSDRQFLQLSSQTSDGRRSPPASPPYHLYRARNSVVDRCLSLGMQILAATATN